MVIDNPIMNNYDEKFDELKSVKKRLKIIN